MRFLNPASYMVLAFTVLSSPAMAGFEFMPPPQKEIISPSVPEVSQEPAVQDYSGMEVETVQPMPVAPVISAPLPVMPAMNAPMPAVPPPPMPQEVLATSRISTQAVLSPSIPQQEVLATPIVPMQAVLPPEMPKTDVPQNLMPIEPVIEKPVRTKTSGLFIDPYPLQEKETETVSPKKMEQALAEKAGGMHPVQLGGGMTTGVNAKSERIVSTKRKVREKSPASIKISSLTPMMGDEPAPLPGYGADTVERKDMRQYAQAVGFGKNLPMALAISQVIPPEFTHRFDGDVDASLKVDWDGGKPWNLVLNDMLREHGMQADIQDNVVVIKETAKI